MRISVFAIFIFLFNLKAFSQNENSTCDKLNGLLEQGKYKAAYRLLVVNGEYSCGNYRYAQVLKWNGRYDEALSILQGEVGTKVDELKDELENLLGIKKKSDLYAINALERLDSVSSLIFLVIDAPVLVRQKEYVSSVFPRKETKSKPVMETKGVKTGYYSLINAEFKRRENNHRLQLGPACIGEDSTLYYTALYQSPLSSSGFHDDFGIYHWDGENHSLLSWINDKATYVHPSISNDNWLIFSSNREGGYGGMDLWKMNLEALQGEPINLGSEVNSEYDEVFPAQAGDSLYFVSNDPNRSLGGYDVLLSYSGATDNPGRPLNSVSDDFNPYTINDELAYLNTDRLYPDSLDIVVKVKPFKSRLLFDLIHGEVSNANLAPGDTVELLDSEGNLLDYTFVNGDGRFTFSSVKGLENYSISFGEEKVEKGDRIFLYDKNYALMEQLTVDDSGQARFELLTPEDYSLDKVVNEDESVLSVDIAGLLVGSGGKSNNGVEIFLQDAQGTTIARAFTNESGKFVFEQVKPDEAYSFTSAVVDMNSEIRIFNQDGEVIEKIAPGKNGEYVYIRLKETDKIITITNESNVQVKVKEKEIFNLPAIYFDLDKAALNNKSEAILGKLISVLNDNPHVSILLSGHTDSKGDAEYNLQLSRQRIKSVQSYLLNNGIKPNRISAEGYGETQLVNNCSDGVDCTEKEHAKNRRIEVQFYGNERP